MTTRQLIIAAIMERLESYGWQSTGPSFFVLGPADWAKVGYPLVMLVPGQETVSRHDYGSGHQATLAFNASIFIRLDQMTKAADEIMEDAFAELKDCLFSAPVTVSEGGQDHYLSLNYESGSVDYDYDVGPGFAGASAMFTVTINIDFP